LTLACDESIHSFNCNLNIADIDANHRKGRIGKMATKKAAKKAPAKKAAAKKAPAKKAAKKK
jgi:topoisomerase IA-like protein